MSLDDNYRVTELFDAAACDWPAPGFADRVLYAAVSSDREVTRFCASLLSDVELDRANRCVTDEGRSHFIQRRAFRRYCGAAAIGSRGPLSQILFAESENGRPYLPGKPDIWFSFSSCRLGFIGAWSSTHALGVDIEDGIVGFEVESLAQTYFTGFEARTVREAGPARVQTFLRLWSLKEAALKSIGEGLPFGLDAFEFELNGNIRVLNAPYGGPDTFKPYLFDRTHISAAIVARMP